MLEGDRYTSTAAQFNKQAIQLRLQEGTFCSKGATETTMPELVLTRGKDWSWRMSTAV